MPSVTFLYRIGSNPKVYYGKYVSNYISDDHEGLDKEVLPDLLNGINLYRQQKSLQPLKKNQVKVGILSCSTNNNFLDYSSRKEIDFFGFYYECYKNVRSIYINGKQVN
jgi:hypothetical protein